MFDKLNKAYLESVRLRRERENKSYQIAKNRLSCAVETKIRTTFIGAINSIEKRFGYLWGIGIDKRNLSPEQLRFRSKWFALRNEILDKGNDQLKAATAEISEYDVKWNGKKFNFNIGANDE